MRILAIDPESNQSAYVCWDTEKRDFFDGWGYPIDKGIISNEEMIDLIDSIPALRGFDLLAIEMVQSYGHSVGRSIFETILWIGRFQERSLIKTKLYTRTTIKGALGGCRTDADVRQAIRQRYGESRKGEKLEGVRRDIWSALALAIALEENPSLKEW